MDELYCPYCGCVTGQHFRQQIPTRAEARERESAMLERMESGQYGFADILVAKVMKIPLVQEQRARVDNAFRSLGLDPGQDIEGKAMYQCSACDRINFV